MTEANSLTQTTPRAWTDFCGIGARHKAKLAYIVGVKTMCSTITFSHNPLQQSATNAS
jgi:hypothetical protein